MRLPPSWRLVGKGARLAGWPGARPRVCGVRVLWGRAVLLRGLSVSVARVWCGTVVLGCMHGCNGVRRVAMGSWLGVGAEIRQRVWRGSGGAVVGCSGGVGLARVKRV